jgi:CBS domain-containing protein
MSYIKKYKNEFEQGVYMAKVKDIMTKNPEFVKPETNVKQAAEKMASLDVGFLPVGDQSNPVGVITDRDIVLRCVAEGKNPEDVLIKDIMTKDIKHLSEDSSIEEAGRIMSQNKIRRTLVVDKNNRTVGVISLGDLSVDGNMDEGGKTLREVSKPSEPDR